MKDEELEVEEAQGEAESPLKFDPGFATNKRGGRDCLLLAVVGAGCRPRL
jgi:hypothetical protein